MLKIEENNAEGRFEIQLSDQSDWKLFDRIADLMEKDFRGRRLEKLDGIDQRYWDIEIDNIVLTLHLEHYLGISLYPAKETEGAVLLVKKICLVLLCQMEELAAGNMNLEG